MATLKIAPLWDEVELPAFPRLDRSLDADVIVVGAGLTGITAATLLHQAGARVVVLERGDVGGIDTGCTTAHLTAVIDTRLSELVRSAGRDRARAVWEAGWAAIQQIDDLIDAHGIACDFAWVPGFLHVAHDADAKTRDRERARLQEELELAGSMGFDAALDESAPLAGTPALRIEHQATFHPRKYLNGLLEVLQNAGVPIFARSAAEITAEGATVGALAVRAPWVVLATHNPLQGRLSTTAAAFLQTKLALYTSYVVRARIRDQVAPALSWDTHDPYRYLRIDRDGDEMAAIAGGADHKTGQEEDPEGGYREVEAWLRAIARRPALTHRWSGQVIGTPDGLPLIGTVGERQFVATGFAGNGMTFGTLAAMMARDAVKGRANPWQDLFDPNRTVVTGGPWTYLTENVDYPYYLVRDRVAGKSRRQLRSLNRNSGAVASIDGVEVAAYRDAQGKLVTLSPTCTHMGCRVRWNDTDKSWECPCHGSRFQPTGEVLAGPAERPLEAVSV